MTTVDRGPSSVAALSALQQHADHPSAFLALNSGNSFFTAPGTEGVIAYRPAGRHLVQFGGPFAPPADQEQLLAAFLAFARAQRRRVTAVQLQGADAELYARSGFTVNQIGSTYGVRLPGFSLRGGRFVKLRNKIARARRAGLEITETPYSPEQTAAVDAAWLRGKGRHVKEIEFMVGECGGPHQDSRRLLLGRLAGEPVAYISYSPAYGGRSGWLHDLSRRLPSAPPGVMEAVNLTAMETFRDEGAEWLHFGFTPFTGLDPDREVPGASRATTRLMRLLAEHGERVYPAASQLAYKEKWAPDLILPEYLAFQGKRADLGAVWRVLQLTKSI